MAGGSDTLPVWEGIIHQPEWPLPSRPPKMMARIPPKMGPIGNHVVPPLVEGGAAILAILSPKKCQQKWLKSLKK